MTKREKRMLISIVGLLILFLHIWGVNFYLTALEKKKEANRALRIKAELYQSSHQVRQQIESEAQWLANHEPSPQKFGDTEVQLLNLLQNKGKQFGVFTEKPRFLRQNIDAGKYRKARIEISATATEDKIYKWILSIHKPSEFRAVTVLKISSNHKDKTQIHCTLVAEQWLIESTE